jgi:hypothetical protein
MHAPPMYCRRLLSRHPTDKNPPMQSLAGTHDDEVTAAVTVVTEVTNNETGIYKTRHQRVLTISRYGHFSKPTSK